jgi:hypothetical protein
MRAFLIHTLVVLLILVLGFSPFIGVAVAGYIAESNGCTLHEGFVNPCVIDGVDRGQDLYTWFVLGWLGIGTVPLGILAAAAYIVIVLIVWLIRRNRRTRQPAAAA